MKVSVVINFMQHEVIYFNKLVESLQSQTYDEWQAIIIDKTSTGELSKRLRDSGCPEKFQVIHHSQPAGFAENYNFGIRKSNGAEFVFVLNPDTYLEPGCLKALVSAMDFDPRVGCVSPKILRMTEEQVRSNPDIVDSTGMYLTRFIRHFDRGAGELDKGQFEKLVYVFGVTGAGAFFRRACLDNIKFDDQFYDEDFWSSREDADISWRLQNRGWKCLYTPAAVMYHVRTLKPGPRSQTSASLRMHGIKNRYLLMMNNMSLKNYIFNLPFILFRDILVVGRVLLVEHSSIPGILYLIRNFPRLLRKREMIRSGTIDRGSSWFGKHQIITD